MIKDGNLNYKMKKELSEFEKQQRRTFTKNSIGMILMIIVLYFVFFFMLKMCIEDAKIKCVIEHKAEVKIQ